MRSRAHCWTFFGSCEDFYKLYFSVGLYKVMDSPLSIYICMTVIILVTLQGPFEVMTTNKMEIK